MPAGAIARALAPFGVQPSAALCDAIREYIQLLLRWNRKISLTSVVQPEEIVQRHFGESMFGAHAVPVVRGRLLDVGSGAGFPALAIKLVAPEIEAQLLEPNLKKAAFLGEVVRALGLVGVRVVTTRAAEMKQVAGTADFVTCRAVWPEKNLLAWMLEALAPQGKCVLWLGASDAAKVREQSGWEWEAPRAVPLSSSRVIQVGTPR